MGRYEYIFPDTENRPGLTQFISNAVNWLGKADSASSSPPVVGTHMNKDVGSFVTLKNIKPADIASNNIQVDKWNKFQIL